MRRLLLALALLLALGGCRAKPKRPERTEPWLASASSSSAAPALARRAHYTLMRSKVEVELPARRATPRGRIARARGELDVDLEDLSHTTGSVALDLADLELIGDEGTVSKTYTETALAWLELGSKVKPEQRDANRTVTFAISSLDAGHLVSAPGGNRHLPRRELSSTWAVRGELSLHGVRAPLTLDASLTLVPGPTVDGPPVELVIRSRRPLVVTLGTHDIRPRDERGVPVAKDLPLLGEKVGSSARVSFELTFGLYR